MDPFSRYIFFNHSRNNTFNKEEVAFYGEVESKDFITGYDLAKRLHLKTGFLRNDKTPWLYFVYKGEVIMVPKTDIRHSISWLDLYNVGAVYSSPGYGHAPIGLKIPQTASVEIDRRHYDVTLLKGMGEEDHVTHHGDLWYGWDSPETHYSEWNELLYRVHSGEHTNPLNPTEPHYPYREWASYRDEELNLQYTLSKESGSWCQERAFYHDSDRRVFRGFVGITHINRIPPTTRSVDIGWRPALRLIR